MIAIDASSLSRLQSTLAASERQVRYAMSRTVNQLAQQSIKDLQIEMRDSFDRPTPWTLRSVRQFGLATIDRPATRIDFKSTTGGLDADRYLRWQVFGGERRLKRFERALRSVGALPDGHFAVPGAGAKFDAYGNVSPGQIVQLLSYFKAFREAGQGWKMNSTDQTRRRMARGTRTKLGFAYFVGRPGGRGVWGIWQRVRIGPGVTELLPILIFVRNTRYEQRFDLEFAANNSIRKHLHPVFDKALREALSTARPGR